MKKPDGTRISRRALLQGSGMAAVAAATATLPGGAAKAAMAPARKGAPRWAMVMASFVIAFGFDCSAVAQSTPSLDLVKKLKAAVKAIESLPAFDVLA